MVHVRRRYTPSVLRRVPRAAHVDGDRRERAALGGMQRFRASDRMQDAATVLDIRRSARRQFFCVLLSLGALGFATACRSTPAPTGSAGLRRHLGGRRRPGDHPRRRRQGFPADARLRQALSEEETLTAKLSLLNDLILQDILLAKAAALKLEVPTSELDTAYANAKKNIADEAFQQELTRRNLTPADMREGLRRELLTQKVIEHDVGVEDHASPIRRSPTSSTPIARSSTCRRRRTTSRRSS